MKLKTLILAGTAMAFAGSAALAQDMTIVSWGGAYSASQNNAYHKPYMEKNPGVNIINDESSAEAVAKLRAMNEAGNITWDLVDVVASDAIRLCDEGSRWKSIRTRIWLLLRTARRLLKISATCSFRSASSRRSFIPPPLVTALTLKNGVARAGQTSARVRY
jgi:hypothetical protein